MTQLTFDDSMDNVNKNSLVEIKAGDKETVDSWYKGRVLSHSSVTLYQTCPQKWKFRYVDKVPEKPRSYFSFGKSVHEGLEFLFSKFPDSVPPLEELLQVFKDRWIREGYESSSQEKWFFNEGERILKGFYSKHKDDFKNVFQIEYKFKIIIDGIPMTGYIDRIDNTPSGNLAIMDYKTGRAFDKSRARKDPQLTLYQLAVKELFGKKVETVALYHLNSLTPLVVPAHSTAMEENLKSGILESAKGIQGEKFDPNPDPAGHCQYCDYMQICPAFAGSKLMNRPKNGVTQNIKEEVDRLGQINEKLHQLNEEKIRVEKSLKSQWEKISELKIQGRHYEAEKQVSEEVGKDVFKTRPYKKDFPQ